MGKKEQIGLRIRTMRKSRRMTQEDLAKAIGQSPSSITMYETGRRAPDYETLEAFADVFNVPLSALVSDDHCDSPEDQPQPARTQEAIIISGGIDKMPPELREQALKVMRTIFSLYFDDGGEKK